MPFSSTEELPVGAEIARRSWGLAARLVVLGEGSTAHHENCFLLLREQIVERPECAAQHEGANGHATGVDRCLRKEGFAVQEAARILVKFCQRSKSV